MQKILLLIISVCLFAINNEILLIESKLYPKILYLVENNDRKENIKMAIVVNESTKKIGLKLKKFIKDDNIKVDIIKKVNLNYDAYIFTTKNIDKKILNKLLKNRKIIFTIYPNYVENAMFSIYIGPKIYPYINPIYLNLSKIKFNPILLKVGKIYEQ
jgi:S-adenosylmethionine:tRNA-ribosyltransferase-isomerase (queuine synthetase)